MKGPAAMRPHLHPLGAVAGIIAGLPECERLEGLAGSGDGVEMAGNSAGTAKRRGPGKPFAPGVSGNPSGRPRVICELRDLARQHTRKAIQTLVTVMQSGESDSARVAAANALLDRGFGKPNRPTGDA